MSRIAAILLIIGIIHIRYSVRRKVIFSELLRQKNIQHADLYPRIRAFLLAKRSVFPLRSINFSACFGSIQTLFLKHGRKIHISMLCCNKNLQTNRITFKIYPSKED